MTLPWHATSVLSQIDAGFATTPNLHAVAQSLGVSIRERILHACEARIVGKDDRAIITVDERTPPARRRYAIAHELGHWVMHREQCLMSGSGETANDANALRQREREADAFAAALLMPAGLFSARFQRHAKLDGPALKDMASVFQVSLSATALRIAELGLAPVMVACYDLSGRKFFSRSPTFPKRVFLRSVLPDDCAARCMLTSANLVTISARQVMPDAFFTGKAVSELIANEIAFAIPKDRVMSVLSIALIR